MVNAVFLAQTQVWRSRKIEARTYCACRCLLGAIHKIRDAQGGGGGGGGGGVLAKESHNHTWGWGVITAASRDKSLMTLDNVNICIKN